MALATEEYLFSVGYKKTSDNTYDKIDKKTGMKVRLRFNPNGSIEQNRKIEQEIIETSTRQDI